MSELSIHPVYLSARAAIVAPEQAIPLTVYATQKWLPRLGPERWCLVMLLRSLSIDSKRRSDGTKRISASWRNLAEMLDVHEETVASWLKHQPIPNDKPWRQIIPSDEKAENLSLFIPRLRYAYETYNGKTRRTGFLLEILMEDPVIPEDEVRLQNQIELMRMQQGSLGLETYRLDETVSSNKPNLPLILANNSNQQNLDLHYVNPSSVELPYQANLNHPGLHNTIVNPSISDLQTAVKQDSIGSDSYVNQMNQVSPGRKTIDSGKNVNELDILIQQLKQQKFNRASRREAFEDIIQVTEALLEDNHSTGMLFKALNTLYPERIDLYLAAVRVALDAAPADSIVNRGAVFVRALRDFADIAGIDLGLKRSEVDQIRDNSTDGNLGSHLSVTSLEPPPVSEAIWSETQLMLRRQMTQATYDAIIQGTILLDSHNGHYTIGVQSEMAKEWLENRLYDIIQRTLSSVIGMSVSVEFKLLDNVGWKNGN